MSMGMGGGGSSGGGGGGVVVGGPTPDSAYATAWWNSQAALAAGQAAQRQTNDAINLLREQYNNAFATMKPYTTQGIQAINEWNQYMGLRSYDPGSAPTAPKLPSKQELINKISNQEIANYMIGNQQFSKGNVQLVLPNGVFNAKGKTWTPQQSLDITHGIQDAIATQQLKDMEATHQSALDTYNQQMDVYNYAKKLQGEYEAQGPYSAEQVQQKLMNQPGVGFAYNQGLDAIQRAASSKGMLGSGRLLQSLVDYGQGVASQQYGDTLSRLAGMVQMGQGSANTVAGLAANLGNTSAQLKTNLGDTIANSYLAAANAQTQGNLAANQQYKIIGGSDGGGGGGGGGFGSALGAIGQIAGMFGGGGLFG